jgi:hypothetical protein
MNSLSLFTDSALFLSNVTYFVVMISDIIYTHILSIVVITTISTIILFSGARNIGKKIGAILGGAATAGSLYTGGKEVVRDFREILNKGPKSGEPSSTPSGSTPTPSGSTPTPSGSTPTPSSDQPGTSKT